MTERFPTLSYARPGPARTIADWWWSSPVAFAGITFALIGFSIQLIFRVRALSVLAQPVAIALLWIAFLAPLGGALSSCLALVLGGESKRIAIVAMMLNALLIWTTWLCLIDLIPNC